MKKNGNEGFSYELMLKTLDHILVGNDDEVEVISHTGVRVKEAMM